MYQLVPIHVLNRDFFYFPKISLTEFPFLNKNADLEQGIPIVQSPFILLIYNTITLIYHCRQSDVIHLIYFTLIYAL